MNKEMSKIETVAVAKAIKKAAVESASSTLVAGEYPVDFTVRIKGSLKKGEDYDQDIVAKADPWLLLAAALSKLNGVTVDSLVREAETQDESLIDGLKTRAAEAIAKIKATTTTKCTGKVTTKLTVEMVVA